MSDTYNPQPWLAPTPSPLGAPVPMSMQVDVKLPSDVNVTDKGALMKIAQGIVQGNGSTLDRFVANARQQISISGTNYYDRQVKGDNLVARYRYNSGQEKLNLEVYPTGGGGVFEQTSERNLDGYIAWIHGEPGYPHDIDGYGQVLSQGPFLLIMNGYVLEAQIQPRQFYGSANCAFYTIMFGPTALLCPSYAGDKDKKNPLVEKTALKQPLRLIPDSSGVVTAGGEIDGTAQGAIPEKFGYWIFDWLTEHNPASFIRNEQRNTAGRWNNPSAWVPAWMLNQHLDAPQSMGGIYFPDTTKDKSPLAPRGVNVIGTDLSAGAKQSIAPDFDCFIAEFYDRGKFTTLSQSWTVPQRANRAIAATNKPLFYAGFLYEVGYTTGVGNNIRVDLDPQTTKDGPRASNTLMGPHDHLTLSGADTPGSGPGDALTDQQKAQVEQWRKDNNDVYQGWADQLQRDFQRVNTLLTDPQLQVDVAWAHLVATISRLHRGNIFLYTTGVYVYWAGDPIVYATNFHDPNYLEHPIYPSGLTSGVVEPDPSYNLYTSALLKNGVNIEGSFTKTFDYDLVLPKDTIDNLDKITHLDNRTITERDTQYIYPDKSTETTSDNISGQGTDTVYESITAVIVETPYGWRSDDTVQSYGPGALSGQYVTVEGKLFDIMTRYDALRKEMDEINHRVPPISTPFPNIGKSLSEFRYSKFGPDFNYNQNP